MTFFEFFQKYNNTFVDTDNAYGPQCMDLMHIFCTDVLGLDKSTLSAPSAKEVWQRFPNVPGAQYFKQIKNTLWNVPQQGDIVFFGVGQYGHVSIFNEGDARRFTSIDQNWPLNSPVHVQEHTYGFMGRSVLGWVRKV